jgi:ATP-dependent Clp protease ATP-binding subunit ClpA
MASEQGSANGALGESRFLADAATPRWARDVFRFLPVKSQFVLSGNVRDRYPYPVEPGKFLPMSLTQYLTEALRLVGYERFLSFNKVEGFSVIVPRGENEHEVREYFKSKFKMTFDAAGRYERSLGESIKILEQVVAAREQFLAVFADFASRYVVRAEGLSELEHDYFARALLLSHAAQAHITERQPQAQYNPIFWICDKENDLPSWLVLDNPRLRAVVIPKPDHVIRRAVIDVVTPALSGYDQCSEAERQKAHNAFVDQTEGMWLNDVVAITQLCRREKLQFQEIGEAVRRYKLGVTEDPWKRLDRDKIAHGESFIERRLKGQKPAVIKSLDIIKRAVVGLSGSQGSPGAGKPRGVMFLAGPTGVGKTELAKTITELLFGDEKAYIRFDMSEFAAEHADQRLLGAPPGYLGFDAGGELTNAIKERPFSVVLFDEIEKAHPRILDKFLQLLGDGVLTSGRGERVYFSESVIIFTSNLGMYREAEDGRRVANVTPEDPYESVEKKVRSEIEFYFKNRLNRPEILNRIGENIVVFDFIRPETATGIYDKMVQDILKRLQERMKIEVKLGPSAGQFLHDRCTADLSNGGRGIYNQLEAWLVNPLARALFDERLPEGTQITIDQIEEREKVPVIRFSKG